MADYRKLPVVIQAVQFRPGENDEEVMAFLDGCIGWHMSDDEHAIVIPTREGDMLARPHWWIIKGVAGEFYPCDPDIFAATYEEVEGPGG